MKNNNKRADNKKTAMICSMSALCISVLAGAYLLAREPERDFTPAPTKRADVTDTWEENSSTNTPLPSVIPESPQTPGTPSANTQTVVSEDETGTTSSLTDNSAKEESIQEKPEMPPETDDDLTEPNKQPEYEPSVPQPKPSKEPEHEPSVPEPTKEPAPQPEQSTPTDGDSTNDSHPVQVYDPVFGWINVGNTQQDNIDSEGDINKQLGTMGGN